VKTPSPLNLKISSRIIQLGNKEGVLLVSSFHTSSIPAFSNPSFLWVPSTNSRSSPRARDSESHAHHHVSGLLIWTLNTSSPIKSTTIERENIDSFPLSCSPEHPLDITSIFAFFRPRFGALQAIHVNGLSRCSSAVIHSDQQTDILQGMLRLNLLYVKSIHVAPLRSSSCSSHPSSTRATRPWARHSGRFPRDRKRGHDPSLGAPMPGHDRGWPLAKIQCASPSRHRIANTENEMPPPFDVTSRRAETFLLLYCAPSQTMSLFARSEQLHLIVLYFASASLQ
jgi:hypothetical protein